MKGIFNRRMVMERAGPVRASEPKPADKSFRWRRCRICAVCIAVFLLAVISFIRSIDNRFVYDDFPIIVNNPSINLTLTDQDPGPWYRFWLEPFWPRGASPDKLYRPLTSASYRLNILLTGGGEPDPRSIRAVNILLHGLTGILVALMVYRLTVSSSAAALAGLLFAVHPVHTEAVVTGYGRAEVMAGFFAAWLLYRHLRPSVERRHPLRFMLFSGLLYLAAIMSKEHALFIWPAVLLIDLGHRWRQQRPMREPLREWFNLRFAPAHVALALAATVFFLLRYNLFGWQWRLASWRTRIWESPMDHAGWIEQALTPFRLLWLTLINLVWPPNLVPIWSYPALSPADQMSGDVIAGMILAGMLLAGVIWLWYRRRLSGALLPGLLFTLMIPLHAPALAHWMYAERWLYLPTVLIAVLLGLLFQRYKVLSLSLGIGLALILLPQTWQYASKFRNDFTLNQEVVLRQPNNYQGRKNLARLHALEGRYDEAIQVADQLNERFGPVSDAYEVMVHSYLALGDERRALEAIEQYEAAYGIKPGGKSGYWREQAKVLIEQQE